MTGIIDKILRFFDSLFGKFDTSTNSLEKKYDRVDSKLESKPVDLESKGDDFEKRAQVKPASVKNNISFLTAQKHGLKIDPVGGRMWANNACNALNSTYHKYKVTGHPEVEGIYDKIDRGAKPIVTKLVEQLGIVAPASAGATKLGELILKGVLGSDFKLPERGSCEIVRNMAIVDSLLLVHEYENDGCGDGDSIKKYIYVYKKA